MSEADIRNLADEANEWTPGENSKPRRLARGSDIEIGKRVIADLQSQRGTVVFCDGTFWYYDDTHWRTIYSADLRCAVHAYDGVEYGVKGVIKLGKTRIDSVINEMGAMLARDDFFAERPEGINCVSGFIRFAQGGMPSLEPHDPEHRCRHVLTGSWVPHNSFYQLLFASSLLRRLIEGVFRGDDDADQKMAVVQEIAGAVAVGYGTRLRRPKAVILAGLTAENGKSQILDLLRGLLPPDAIASIPASHMADERYVPWLIGKHLNAADELSGANAIASDRFKAIVTGDPVTGRDAYRSIVTFRPVAQHVFCANSLPSFAGGMDRGVQRRLLVIPFNRVIPKEERIERIGQLIGEEDADLLLAWAVEGASRLIRQRDFTIPPSSEVALKTWLSTADPVIAWAEEHVTAVDPKSADWGQARLKSKDAYAHFRAYAIEEGYPKDRLPALSGFLQRLMAHRPTIERKHTKTGNYWLTGIRIEGYDPEAEEQSFARLRGETPVRAR